MKPTKADKTARAITYIPDPTYNNMSAWIVNSQARISYRIERLETLKLSPLEAYEELLELMAELELFWEGLEPEELKAAKAREIRPILDRCLVIKAKIKGWAHKQLTQRRLQRLFDGDREVEIL